MTKYIIYKHTSPNGKIYIGMTSQKPQKRWQNGKAYKENEYFNRAIKKYGWNNFKHEILKENLSKEEAEKLEIYLINVEYKSNIRKNGYNIEYGGCHKGKTSEETKRKISKANKGKHNSPSTEFRKGHITIITEDIKEKISKANKGKHMSKRTEFKKGHKPLNCKMIRCIETNEIYKSIKEASLKTNASASSINKVCKGTRLTANKLHWEYV